MPIVNRRFALFSDYFIFLFFIFDIWQFAWECFSLCLPCLWFILLFGSVFFIVFIKFVTFQPLVMHCLMMGKWSEKYVIGRFHYVNIIVHLHKPKWYSLLHPWAIWCSLLLLGYKPVQDGTVENNTRVNQAPGKIMQSRYTVNMRCGCCRCNTAHCFIAKYFYYVERVHSTVMIKSIV